MTIVHAGPVSGNLLHLCRVAQCFGLQTELIDVTGLESLLTAVKKATAEGKVGLVFDVTSLKDCTSRHVLQEAVDLLSTYGSAVLLFVTSSDETTNQFVRMFTGGEVTQINRIASATRISFPVSGRAWSGELSSQTFPREAKDALALAQAEDARFSVVMEVDDSPTFACFRSGPASVFVWSTPAVFDIHRELAAEKEFELAADEYLPAIIFLRSAFGDQCWHNPSANAGIVIDDPLLKKRYGFINFVKLLESARKHSYHVTLAFIPWNHWRSRLRNVRLFRKYADCFRICFHGCDHTRNEYGVADYDVLLRKNFVARERMERHRRRTGLPSEPLMVCPQERYSLEAMQAFSDSRQFIGLICTACMPRNLRTSQLTGADLLLPAQDSFFGFPVFKRHYWNGMRVFALALFLGKPAILVEHHEFFRNGAAGAEEFARFLSQLRPDLKWQPLAETIRRTHARRRVSQGRWEVRFFTDAFQLEHALDEPTAYSLLRRIPETTMIERVLVDGKEVPFSRQNGFLSFETQAQHPQTLSIQVEVAPLQPTKAYSSGLKYQAFVALRRGLSEVRDNIIARNRLALRAGRFLIKSLKQTAR